MDKSYYRISQIGRMNLPIWLIW